MSLFPPKTDEMNNIVLQNYNKIIKQMRDFALSLELPNNKIFDMSNFYVIYQIFF
jgi:hypothetical protein